MVCIPFTFPIPSTPVLGKGFILAGGWAGLVVVGMVLGTVVGFIFGFRVVGCCVWVGVWVLMVTWVLVGVVGFVLGTGGWLRFCLGLVHFFWNDSSPVCTELLLFAHLTVIFTVILDLGNLCDFIVQ